VIPGVITWHLLAESRAKRELSTENDSLKNQNSQLNDEKQGLNHDKQELTQENTGLNQRNVTLLAKAQSDEGTIFTLRQANDKLKTLVPSTQEEKTKYPGKLVVPMTTRASQNLDASTRPSSPATAPAVLLGSTDTTRIDDDSAILPSNSVPLYALANFITPDEPPKVLWDAGMSIAEPRIELAAPMGGQFNYTPKGTNIKISDQKQGTFAWLELEDGQLKFVSNGGLDTNSKDFKNWLRLAYVRVFDGKRIIAQVRFAPLIRKAVASVDVDLDLPEYIKSAKIALKSEMNQRSSGWEIKNTGCVIDCSSKDNSVYLWFENGRIINEPSTKPSDSSPPAKLPSMVVDLVYNYDDYPPLTLCRLTINAQK